MMFNFKDVEIFSIWDALLSLRKFKRAIAILSLLTKIKDKWGWWWDELGEWD